MASQKDSICFIGLGAMGFGMAVNLVKLGYAVTGYDVYAPTLRRFAEAGGRPAASAAAAARDASVCICMVATAQQAQSVLLSGDDAAALALPRGATLLLCSTVPCAYVRSLASELVSSGRPDITLVDCPVSGGAGRAAAGTLSIMASGTDDAIARGKDVLSAMADPAKLYIVAGGIGAGSSMKMVHQVLAACHILGASEAMGFAAHMGLDPGKTAAAIIGHAADTEVADEEEHVRSDSWSWMFENRVPRMIHPSDGPTASALTIILKDTQIITSEARRCGFPSLLTAAAEQVYLSCLGKGYGPEDDSSVIRFYTEGIGCVGPVQGSAQSEGPKTALVQGLLTGIHLCSAAESLAFARRVGLDLDQVLDLCVNAAGGSTMLAKLGPSFVNGLRNPGERLAETPILDNYESLLRSAVEEAQGLKLPLVLGNQALRVFEMAKGQDCRLVNIWEH